MSVTLNFNIHDSYSDCEDCGSYSNDIITVTCETHKKFETISTGTGAHCYDMEEADYHYMVEEVFSRLEGIGFTIPRPEWKERSTNSELEQRYKENIVDRGLTDRNLHPTWASWPKDTDWDTYWEYDYYRSREYEDKYYTFYEYALDLNNPDSFVSYLQKHGITVEIENTEDERYDAYRWNDYDYDEDEQNEADEHDSYFDETFDQGYDSYDYSGKDEDSKD